MITLRSCRPVLKRYAFMVLWLGGISPVFADISGDLAGFFNRLGFATSSTESGSFQNQAAGYYTGGSLVTRSRPRNVQFGTVQMPGFKAGCGGIDAFTGGFSHIKSGELVQAMKGIGSAMVSYAFMLGVQTVSPQIYNTLNELNTLATRINNMNINSCEAGATMIGGAWPKTDMANNHLCKSMGASMGSFSDWAHARQGCPTGGSRDRVLKDGQSKGEFKNMLAGEYNLAWKALQNYAFLQESKDLAEFFMTLSGTLISRKSGDGHEIESLSSLADSGEILTALLEGGQATIYKCNGDEQNRCLNPLKKSHQISPVDGFKSKVSKILSELVSKIYKDEALTEPEKSFLSSTKLPVYKILNVITVYKRGGAPIDIQEYADIIALDIVYQYIGEVLDLIHDNLNNIKRVQVDDSDIEKFQAGLGLARSRIVEKRTAVFQHLQAILSLVKKTQLMEKQMYGLLSMSEGDR